MSNKKSKSIIKFRDEDFIAQLGKDLMSFGRVKVSGLGYFALKRMKGREGYHIGEKKMVKYPPYVKIVFTASSTLKKKTKKWLRK